MRLLLLTGTGGAGTTTTAAATAVHAAASGVKTLLLSTSAREMADVLALPVADPDAEPAEVVPGLGWAALDGTAPRLRQGLDDGLRPVLAALGLGSPASDERAPLPGWDDVAVLSALREHVDAGRHDLLVVDLGPVEAAVRLVGCPEALDRHLDLLLPHARRVSGAVAASPRRPDVVAAGVDAARRRLAAVREPLTSPGTSALVVTGAGAVPARRAARALTGLALHGVRAERLAVPRLPVEPVGVAALAALGEAVAGSPAGPRAAAALLAVPPPGPVRVERDGAGFALVVDLGQVTREDVTVGLRGDVLLVEAAGHRRTLPLQPALQRCRVTGARVVDGSLRVAFQPDPDLWPTP